ncbi:MAG: hypothetical protein AAF845_03340 [Bacteroidota bacterium]
MTGLRLGAAVGLSLMGIAAGGVLLSQEAGPYRLPEAEPLLLVDATATALDSVRLGGRRVTATLNGVVVQHGPAGDVWLDTGEDAVRLAFPEAVGLEVEDRVLAVGRLRGRGGRRWVEVDAWSVVTGAVESAAVRERL